MKEQLKITNHKNNTSFSRKIGEKEKRMLQARRNSKKTAWFGLGMFGLIGWAVAVPTILGTALGVWLDEKYPGKHSWTLTMLIIGLTLGCLNAWQWVTKESKEIHKKEEEEEDE
ncbi:MAG: AtpZ/AtpI family protein [Acidobacteria bacterium]|nr:AtpZ/AtpI family protein [Acidobacteriota bacterium]